jgi:hypothetical protein
MNRNKIALQWPKMRKKQSGPTRSWQLYQLHVAAQFVPPTQPKTEPDVSTNRLPDCQPWTLNKAL